MPRLKNIIKFSIYTVLVLFASHAKAQVADLQYVIDKLESYKNFSYHSTEKLKEMASDTLMRPNNDLFIKAPEDKIFGYYFKLENNWVGENFVITGLYNGQKLTYLHPSDTTYENSKIDAELISYSTLPGILYDTRSFLKKNPSKIIKANDTTINGIVNIHLIAKIIDTIINKEHHFTYRNIFINKQSGLPSMIFIQARDVDFGAVNTYYSKTTYTDYKFNDENISVASLAVPVGYHPPKPRAATPFLLTAGLSAPEWTLESTDGKKVSLNQLKGKVVLMDFYFIGCLGCMESIQPLNNIYKKYKNQNVVMASLTQRDSKKAVLAFDKQYNIKYPAFTGAADVFKAYHVNAAPTFYIVDKEGKIANAFDGYNDGFEKKVTSIIDGLLKK